METSPWFLDQRKHGFALFNFVCLVDRQNDVLSVFTQKVQDNLIFRTPAGGFNHHYDGINIGQTRADGLIHTSQKFGRMLSLKSRCIDEQVLSIISGQNAHDSITSRLGFLAGNTDLFPDQRVDQRALADVRTAITAT